MSYTVMALKWRPQIFDEVVAQEHITETIQNAIRQNRVAHAYLFSGPRGTGKTTTARLLAKALNCESGPTPHPCGICRFCKAIANGTSADVREIDGASTGLVEDIRQLREEVGYASTKGKRKIYIIDEVHMLSQAAFNALLKTLEEPPPHVIFVFATTEPHKVPETVLSRCQRYQFKRIGAGDIVKQLTKILQSENKIAEEAALFQIAKKADGGMRDALSLLDQVVAFSDAGITTEAVAELLGLIPRDLYFELTRAIRDKDGPIALGLVSKLVVEGSDLGEFVEGLMEHFRHLLVARAVGELTDEDLPLTDRKQYAEMAAQFHENDLLRMLQVVSELETQLARVSEPRFWLELTLMKLVKMTSSVDLGDLFARLEKMERMLKGRGSMPNGPAPEPNVSPVRPSFPTRPIPAPKTSKPENGSQAKVLKPDTSLPDSQQRPAPKPVVPVMPETSGLESPLPTIDMVRQNWVRFVQDVKARKISVGTFLAEGRPKTLEGQVLMVGFPKNKEFHANQVRRNRAMVEEVAGAVFGGSMRLECTVDYEEQPAESEGHPQADDRVQMVLQIFGGEVVR